MSSSMGKTSLVDFVDSIRRQNKELHAMLDQSLLESMGEVLESVLGKQAANLMKNHLNIASSSREKANFDPQIVSENLEKLLGAGAKFIELEIIRTFSTKYC